MGCGKKEDNAPDKSKLIQESYNKTMTQIWFNLEPIDVMLLKETYDHTSEGGLPIVKFRYHQAFIEKLVERKLLKFNPESEKYTLTELGKDTYLFGTKLVEEEHKKPKHLQSARILKEGVVASNQKD